MPRYKFSVQPQRSSGMGYIDCEVHRATSWAVMKSWTYRNMPYRQVISRHSTRTQAEGEVHSQDLNAAGPLRRYALGKRMVKS